MHICGSPPHGNRTVLQAVCEGTVELPSLDPCPGNATKDVVSGTVLPTGSNQRRTCK